MHDEFLTEKRGGLINSSKTSGTINPSESVAGVWPSGHPGKSPGSITGGRMVSGFSGNPEQRPGYSSEHSVPNGHSAHGSPILYISDLIRLPARP